MGNTTVYKTSAVREIGGFNSNLKSYTDNFLSMMLAFKGGACFIPDVLATWKRGNDNYADSIYGDIETMESIFAYARDSIKDDYKDICNGAVYQAWDARMKYDLVACEMKNKINKNISFNNKEEQIFSDKVIKSLIRNDFASVSIRKALAGLLLVPKHAMAMLINIFKWHLFLFFNKYKLIKRSKFLRDLS